MKIMFYALRSFDELAYCERFKQEYGIDYVGCSEPMNPGNLELARGCDAVSTTPCEIRPEYLETFAELGVQYLPCRSIGYDHIPLETAKRLGLRVSHSSYPPEGVANYTVMLLLMSLRKMNQIMLCTAAQDFSLPGKMGRDLSCCTVGVVGTGKIGQTVVRQLGGFGCKLLAYDLYPNEELAKTVEYVDFDTLCRESDIITLHLNATPENYHMFDASAFARMKQGTLLINTARGTLVDSGALIGALEQNHLGGAALDVVEDENGMYYNNLAGKALPNREMNILRSMPNVIISPHTAFYTDVNVASMVRSPFEALRLYAAGEENPNEVKL